jgi:hypothetical protein
MAFLASADDVTTGVLQVDEIIRGHGLRPSEDVRSLLAAATEHRMAEFGEPFGVAVTRAVALLAASARRRG